jgi:hypothetical protein
VFLLAYGGAVLSARLAAVPVGRVADRVGVRKIVATGALLGGVGVLPARGACARPASMRGRPHLSELHTPEPV